MISPPSRWRSHLLITKYHGLNNVQTVNLRAVQNDIKEIVIRPILYLG